MNLYRLALKTDLQIKCHQCCSKDPKQAINKRKTTAIVGLHTTQYYYCCIRHRVDRHSMHFCHVIGWRLGLRTCEKKQRNNSHQQIYIPAPPP